MSPGGRKPEWVTLVGGPLDGQRTLKVSFFEPGASHTCGVPVDGSYDLVDFHRYELVPGEPAKARWAGFVRRGPYPQGPSTPTTMREL